MPFLALTWDQTAASEWAHDEHSRKLVAAGWPEAYPPRTYIATLVAAALPTAIAVVVLFLVAFRIFEDRSAATVAALTFGMATPAFGWATTLFGHAAAGAFLFLGFAFAHAAITRPEAGRFALLRAAASAAALTLSITVDFTVAPAAVMVVLWAAGPILRDPKHRVAMISTVLVAGLISALPLLIYNDVTFGAPWRIGYGSDPDFPGMKQGFFGITLPKLSVLYEILFGPSRGILQISPVLIAAPFGIYRMCRNPAQRGIALLVIGVIVYHLLLNASFHYWEGGWSTGPRYLTAMLPFACLAIGGAWAHASPAWRWVLLGLLAVSLVISACCAMVGMDAPAPEKMTGSLIEHVWSRTRSGASHALATEAFGMRSRYFLLLLLTAWALIGALLARYSRKAA